MIEWMDTFYTCINKALVEDILSGDGEYLLRAKRQEGEITRLIIALDQDTALRVDDLLTEQLAIGELRECAYFRAGFRIALELMR